MDYRDSYSVLQVDNIPEEALPEVQEFHKTLEEKYLGRRIDEDLKIAMNYEIKCFNKKIKEKYGIAPEKPVARLMGGIAYHNVRWSINDIVREHEKYCKNTKRKKKYTRMDINNMLFDLQLVDRIQGYENIAVPYDIPSYNDKQVNEYDFVHVRCRYD